MELNLKFKILVSISSHSYILYIYYKIRVAYKIKTTHPNLMWVNPVLGVFDPNEIVKISIDLNSMEGF